MEKRTIQGAGMGLRIPHAASILDNHTEVAWFELLADNWLSPGGINQAMLRAVTERYPCVLHGVGLSLGGVEPLDFSYLARIKRLQQQTGALWYSEHCSFTIHNGVFTPDLLPLPYTQIMADHLAGRIQQVQDFMGERILLENASAYLGYAESDMSDGEFIRYVAEKADCHLLLDVNNAYVCEVNELSNCTEFLATIPAERVRQIHLAGFDDRGSYLVDAHNNPVADPVWEHYRAFIHQHGAIPSMIEWDNDIPPLEGLLAERDKIQTILDSVGQHGQEVAA